MKKLLALAVGLSLVLLAACAVAPTHDPDETIAHTTTTVITTTTVPAVWQTITAEQAHAIMAQAESFVLLDVRTAAEFGQAHIGGAWSMPYDELSARTAELPAQDKLILIYCQSGRRSAIAAATLAGLGFSAVHDFGGINDWPFGVVRENHQF